ncbi:MAG TPA: glycine cleavage T C-terminal barrel domain-containing protein [Acidobacteriaceae bacterium]|nr:glycine cleavage T C-terminal barrel domain-containing protein [Acidobacteriaceae bacterium]
MKLQQEGGPRRQLIGLEMTERGIGRDGYPVCTVEGEEIGIVTSGSPAPFLKKNIALAYVPLAYSQLDTELAVKIRGQNVRARVVNQPFYRRPKQQS